MRTLLTGLLILMGIGMVRGQEIFSLMSYNVRYDEALFNVGEPKENDWANRKAIQAALISFHEPDIVGLQEPHLHQVKYFEQMLPGYGWLGVGREDGKEEGEYNPIFYNKRKLELIDSGTFWLSDSPEKPSKSWDAGYTRICTWGQFELKETGKPIYIFNTHFDSKGKIAREKSAELINNKIEEIAGKEAVMVMGDFNFSSESSAYKQMTSYGLMDSKRISKARAYGPEGTFNGFRFGQTPQNRIDFVFVNQKVEVCKYGVLTDKYDQKFPSDHLPVMVKVNLD
ncbi:endonuclease/exonuclease/phosphatase family protein [Echinicola shivajiensis]|uniref:endonuclease/exonuclease/phosphatase family protein n=1 Tax=Echinicola shivajiensis TaxID=1035916 RepID=UPI001BFBFEE1|nr:endonuclease/exonuclease/phosphatase family protein [Echinicola shivajiensis]